MNQDVVVVIYNENLPQQINTAITQASAQPRHYRQHTDFPDNWVGEQVKAVLLHYSNESKVGSCAAAWLKGYFEGSVESPGLNTATTATGYREFGELLQRASSAGYAPVIVFSGAGHEAPARLCEDASDRVYPASLGHISQHMADFLSLLELPTEEWPDKNFFWTDGLQGTMPQRALNLLITLLPPTLDWGKWNSDKDKLQEESRQTMSAIERIMGWEKAEPLWKHWSRLFGSTDQMQFMKALEDFRDVLLPEADIVPK